MTGIELITQERKRQIEKEGWSIETDMELQPCGELAIAAMCYASPSDTGPFRFFRGKTCPAVWPWDASSWKPSLTKEGRIQELAKAGALIAAEIDRLQPDKNEIS